MPGDGDPEVPRQLVRLRTAECAHSTVPLLRVARFKDHVPRKLSSMSNPLRRVGWPSPSLPWSPASVALYPPLEEFGPGPRHCCTANRGCEVAMTSPVELVPGSGCRSIRALGYTAILGVGLWASALAGLVACPDARAAGAHRPGPCSSRVPAQVAAEWVDPEHFCPWLLGGRADDRASAWGFLLDLQRCDEAVPVPAYVAAAASAPSFGRPPLHLRRERAGLPGFPALAGVPGPRGEIQSTESLSSRRPGCGSPRPLKVDLHRAHQPARGFPEGGEVLHLRWAAPVSRVVRARTAGLMRGPPRTPRPGFTVPPARRCRS